MWGSSVELPHNNYSIALLNVKCNRVYFVCIVRTIVFIFTTFWGIMKSAKDPTKATK